MRTQAQDGIKTHVRREKAGRRVGDGGIVTVRGTHDRCGLHGAVDGKDTGRAEGGREGDVKPGVLGRGGRGRQIEKDLGRRSRITRSRGYGGLAIVPVGARVAGPRDKTDPVGILGGIGHKRAPGRRDIVRWTARVGWQDAAIGRRLVFPVIELI